MRKVEVDIAWALSLIHCAKDYGFQEIIPDLVDLIGGFTMAEADQFAEETYLSGQGQSQGYTDEDYDDCIETLSKYAKDKQS